MTVGNWGGLPQTAVLTFWCSLASQWKPGSLSPEAQHTARMQSVFKSKMGTMKKVKEKWMGREQAFVSKRSCGSMVGQELVWKKGTRNLIMLINRMLLMSLKIWIVMASHELPIFICQSNTVLIPAIHSPRGCFPALGLLLRFCSELFSCPLKCSRPS